MYFSESNKMNVFDITPVTYVLDLSKEDCDLLINSFIKFFEINMPQHMRKNYVPKLCLDIKKKKQLNTTN